MALNRFLIVVVIIAVIAMGYAFLNTNNLLSGGSVPVQKKSFEQGFSELKGLIAGNYSKFILLETNLTDSELNEINSKIIAFKSKISSEKYSEPLALTSLAEIYEQMAQINLQKNAVNKTIQEERTLNGDKEICSNLYLFERLDSETLQLISKLENLDESILDYSSRYKSKSETAGLTNPAIDVDALKANQAKQASITIQLNETCSGGSAL